ncbi:MAG: FtsQ-type POTRA domain-containing protein [Candidatus Aminicenantes bacterium]|nr:FtsQ-type POTRA domain-containing protein [Candidatus Aminicenantes bacterium]
MSGPYRRGAGDGRVRKPVSKSRLSLPLAALGLAAAGLLFFGLHELYGFLLTWDELTIGAVEVSCPDPAVAVLAEEIAGGRAWGNILLLDVDRVAAELSASPRVAAARVRKVFPATLRIEVVPRRPAAVLEGAEPELIARDGVVLGPADSADAGRLPVLKDEGGFAQDRRAKLDLAWACLDDLGPNLAESVECLDLSETENLVLVLRGDPTRLKLGNDLYRPRLREWLAVREDRRREFGPMEYVDLRFAGRTIFKPARAASPPPAAVPGLPAEAVSGEAGPRNHQEASHG